MSLGRRAVVVPYRDSYFVNKIGFAVRDVQVVEEIRRSNVFEKIFVVNRPVSLYERILFKKRFKDSSWPYLETYDATSMNLLGPLRRRLWLPNCYDSLFLSAIEAATSDGLCSDLVVLDFHPIAMLERVIVTGCNVTYWYDMIDNFSIHNRYSLVDREAVLRKYAHVEKTYDFVSGVSSSALKAIGHKNSFVMSNGVFVSDLDGSGKVFSSPEYDFGFVGFVTDKFDVEIVRYLIGGGFSVVVHGAVLDRTVSKELSALGAVLGGEFSYDEIENRISSFKVGLLPYVREKEHDGSPLKLYEYLKWNRPCLSSIDYEIVSPYVVNYKYSERLLEDIDFLVSSSGDAVVSSSIQPQWFLSSKVASCMKECLRR